MKRIICNAGVLSAGILFCTAAFALGPPGPAHNGGTGNGIDNFFDQLPVKTTTVEQNNALTSTQAQKPKKDDYPRYVNIPKPMNITKVYKRTSFATP